jgi:hypothetical protein
MGEKVYWNDAKMKKYTFFIYGVGWDIGFTSCFYLTSFGHGPKGVLFKKQNKTCTITNCTNKDN